MKACENCGTRLDGSYCPNCCEEIFIEQQYMELGESVPPEIKEIAQEQRRNHDR